MGNGDADALVRRCTAGQPMAAAPTLSVPEPTQLLRRSRSQNPATTPHIAISGIRVARPCSPIACPTLNAPWPPAASLDSSIDSRFAAIWPAQNAGHEEWTMGQLPCMASCDDVETTIRVTKTLQHASAISTRRHASEAWVQATARPRPNIGITAPAYRGPKARPAFHQ